MLVFTGRPLHCVPLQSVPEVQALKREIPVLRHLDGSFYLRYTINRMHRSFVQ